MNQCIKNKRTPTIKEIKTYLDHEFEVFVSSDNTRLIASVSDCIQSSIDQDLMFRFEKETKKSTWSKATKYIIFIYRPLPQYCLINDSGKNIVLNEDMNVYTKKLKLFEDFIKKNNLTNENSLNGVHQHSSEATFIKFLKYTGNRSFLNMDTEEGVEKRKPSVEKEASNTLNTMSEISSYLNKEIDKVVEQKRSIVAKKILNSLSTETSKMSSIKYPCTKEHPFPNGYVNKYP